LPRVPAANAASARSASLSGNVCCTCTRHSHELGRRGPPDRVPGCVRSDHRADPRLGDGGCRRIARGCAVSMSGSTGRAGRSHRVRPLDNFEPVLPAASLVTRILGAARRVGSWRPAELRFASPANRSTGSLRSASRSQGEVGGSGPDPRCRPALRRAGAGRGFVLSPHWAQRPGRGGHRLAARRPPACDELAAARVRVLSPRQILSRLERRLACP
jgi:hypothetical protein